MTARPSADWIGRRVLVTGGTGFVGVNLCRRLVGEGATVTVLSRRPDAASTPGLPDAVRLERGDVRDASAIHTAMAASEPQVVFHLASTAFNPPGTSDAEHREVIVEGTAAVLSALTRSDVRLVHVGSAAEYGTGSHLREDAQLRPTTALGSAKAEASRLVEHAAHRPGMNAVILRLFTPYGPWDRPSRLVIHTALGALEGVPIRISDGRQQRDFVFVEDVVSAMLVAGSRAELNGSKFNICSGIGVSVREMVDLVLTELGITAPVLVGAIQTRPDEIWELSGDNAAAANGLGWHPMVDLRFGVAKTCAWIIEHRERLTAVAASGRA